MAETGLYEDGKRGIRRVTDPHLRVKDAELDGVDAEVIFGILGAATRLGDNEAAREMFRIYNVNILAAVIGAAVLERYPSLRIGFGESGIGWIPYALDRMDFEWEDRFRDLGLTMKPSDYWRRQCKATFQFDRIGTKLIDEMGVETIMWASDYPHTDGVWPESSKYIAEQFGHLPADVVRKITCENAGKFYGLMT
jgi:predicted TIM-barrel fold metal-dependent hydrolase